MNPLVSIIIVNWNGAEVLDKCLNSLTYLVYQPVEIIIWDNNSSDSSKRISEKYQKVKFISKTRNYGFAEANNLAIEYTRGRYILLLNNDTVVTKNFLDPLVEILENKKNVGVVQPTLLFAENSQYRNGTVNSLGAYLTPTGFLYYPRFGKDPEAIKLIQSDIYSAYGACMLIRKTLIDRIGLFDADFFAYFEETDFCHRVWLSGSKVMCEPASIVNHRGSITSAKYGMNRIIYHSYKNRICSYLKNLDTLNLLRILPLHLAICGLMSINYLVKGQLGLFWAVVRAASWNLINFPRTLSKRAYIQNKIRKLPDRLFIPFIMKKPVWKYYYYLTGNLEKLDDPLVAP